MLHVKQPIDKRRNESTLFFRSIEDKKLTLCNVNVQSLLSKVDEIQIFSQVENVDIICITEHWLQSKNVCDINIPGYKICSHFSRNVHIHGGSLILCRDCICNDAIEILKIKKKSVECHIEMCGIIYNNIAIICVYRPPNGELDIFFENVTAAVEMVMKRTQLVILCGDFNIDYVKDSLAKQTLCDILSSFELNITTCDPTRIFTMCNGRTCSSAIDYLSTNLPVDMYVCKIVDPCIADHFAQIITIKNGMNEPISKSAYSEIEFRNLSENNLKLFVDEVAHTDWSFVCGVNDINVAFSEFINTLLFCLNTCCPLVRKKRDTVHKKKSWFNDNLMKQRKELKRLYGLVNSTNSENSRMLYQEMKREYKKDIRITKREHYKNRINSAENRSKEIWKIINTKLNRNKNKANPIKLLVNDKVIKDSDKIANTFANFFSTISNIKLFEHFGENLSLPCTTMDNQPQTLFVRYIDEYTVKNEIKKLNNKKSAGLDEITTKLLKLISDIISAPLVYLINKSLESGIFPDILKVACVIPLYKKDDQCNIENYRQISLLSVFSKLIERLIHNMIVEFLNLHNIITPCQHGFISTKSIETASYHLLNSIYNDLDEGKYVMSLMFDLSRAFDTVNIEFLVTKLYNMGIRGNLLQWIKSYMSNRKLLVKYADTMSDVKDVQMGVPQGSVLGPLLFTIYVNDLPTFITKGRVTMFADDTTITVSAQDPEELSKNITHVYNELDTWCQRNQLILNEKKTVFINFHIRRELAPEFLTENNIDVSQSAKFLGTWLDSKLSWNVHVDFVCKKLNSAYFAIFQMKTVLDVKGLLNIYYALAYSHLAMNIVTWGVGRNVSRVLISQKRIIRLIFSLQPLDSCRDIFRENKIMTVIGIFILKCVCFVHKNIRCFSRLGDTHSYKTRYNNDLTVPLHTTNFYKQSPNYNFITLFNKLPSHLKNVTHFNKFKNASKNYLLEKSFYSLQEFLCQ